MKTMNRSQLAVFATMKSRDSKLQMRWDHDKMAPAALKGFLAEPFQGPAAKLVTAAALDFLDDNKQLFRMNKPKEELSVIQKTTDARGNLCVALQQKYERIPVEGATVRVHFNLDKTVYQVTSKYEPGIELDDVEPTISCEQSYARALEDAGGGTRVDAVIPELVICPEKDGPKLAWVVEVIGEDTKLPMKYYVDAKDGTVLRKFSDLYFMGTGTGIYSGTGALHTVPHNGAFRLIDNTRKATGGPAIHICDMNNSALYGADTEPKPDLTNVCEDTDNNWEDNTTIPRHNNQRTEVDIHRYMGEVVDYFRDTHDWNSFDNLGSDIFCGAHARISGSPNNAAYSPTRKCFYFGDGDNVTFNYLSPLDVVAHEFMHGVTDYTSKLFYNNQSGGLNEAFSDIFAAFIDNADTQIGEDCTTPTKPGDCLRRMDDPSSSNALSRIPNHVLASHDSMNIGYYDGQDPHYACGPVIYAAALLLVGGTHPNTNITVQPIGYARCEQIFWHVQSNGLLGNSNATFLECREAAVNAVDALFSDNADYLRILNSVKNAFTAVGIGPDIYIRDNTGDDGTVPNTAPLYRSPDIIVRQNEEASPQTAFADLDDDSLSENAEAGQNNWIYLRLQNRGSVVGDVEVNVYWAAPNTFAFPSQWNLIDTVNVMSIQPGGLSIGALKWRAQDLPPMGHFCLIAELHNTVDPAPDKTLITNGETFSRFVAESNNFAWKNINVVDVLPSGLAGFNFLISGDDESSSEVQIDLTELPDTAEVYMRALGRLCEDAEIIGMSFLEANSRYKYYDLVPGTVGRIRNVSFANNDTSEIHLYARIPEGATQTYSITTTQLTNGNVTGRITQVLNLMSGDVFGFIGNVNTREVHEQNCRWVGTMSDKNKRGFRSLNNAHQAGYDNCAYCIGDSKR